MVARSQSAPNYRLRRIFSSVRTASSEQFAGDYVATQWSPPWRRSEGWDLRIHPKRQHQAQARPRQRPVKYVKRGPVVPRDPKRETARGEARRRPGFGSLR